MPRRRRQPSRKAFARALNAESRECTPHACSINVGSNAGFLGLSGGPTRTSTQVVQVESEHYGRSHGPYAGVALPARSPITDGQFVSGHLRSSAQIIYSRA